ncbi:NAD-dependent protein deacetylase sirtuin-1 isoform X2 [Prorops nasuta]|uniref:NAD-dependent protein deacetylase sirtuin-1 isoform X2 n=1 Tax=Prorops nasuta TaxID=863751 RepID=UPI0034CFDCEF
MRKGKEIEISLTPPLTPTETRTNSLGEICNVYIERPLPGLRQHIELCSALLSKMASSAEQPDYSSPVKRRKINDVDYGANICTESDFSDCKPSRNAPNDDFEETLGTDSGFTELSDESKSASTSPDSTNLITPLVGVDSTTDNNGGPMDIPDDKDEVSSTVSNLSDLSGLSELSGDGEAEHQWRNASSWIQKQMLTGANPRELLHHLLMDSTQIPEQVDDLTLWKIIINMMSEPPRRQKLRHINTLTDVVRLIRNSKKIIVLTGAGVSVSCGIPDFRSRDGIYSRLAKDFPDLPDPQAMFDINYFAQDPRPFFKFAREIYPGQFKPSPCHRFIKMLEKQRKLLRNYSQNIDTLEQVAGIENVIECHGSFATASCTKCKYQVKCDDIREDIFAQKIPICPKCRVNTLPSIIEFNPNESYRELVSQGIMKPDIVFFGEGLPDAFHYAMAKDKDDCDLLIVIGSSLKVRPVALIPSSIPPHVPQILINREPLPHLKFDVELLGDGDIIINQLCYLLGDSFQEVCWNDTILKETSQLLPRRYIPEDTWEQSQDTTINNEFATSEREQVKLNPQNVLSESQDSITADSTIPTNYTESTGICISPFHAGHMEQTEESFAFLGDSPKRRLGDSSVESSPKRMNFGNSPTPDCNELASQSSLANVDCPIRPSQRNSHIISVESTSDRNGQIYNLEECQVVPRAISESDDPITVHASRSNGNTALQKLDDLVTTSSDKTGFKPRQASIDSAMDSGIGDSCNSVDSTEEKNEVRDSKQCNLDRIGWQNKIKESLAIRLPENAYYQLTTGRYIFPGAEVYSDPEDFDQCSLSANSDSSESDSDSSLGDEEDDDEEEEEEDEEEPCKLITVLLR